MLDAQGFGLSPRGCRSFGEAAIDLFLALHRFQHVFRVRPSPGFTVACFFCGLRRRLGIKFWRLVQCRATRRRSPAWG
jgi:hypothetical protein